jgi:hypothetical protein
MILDTTCPKDKSKPLTTIEKLCYRFSKEAKEEFFLNESYAKIFELSLPALKRKFGRKCHIMEVIEQLEKLPEKLKRL